MQHPLSCLKDRLLAAVAAIIIAVIVTVSALLTYVGQSILCVHVTQIQPEPLCQMENRITPRVQKKKIIIQSS